MMAVCQLMYGYKMVLRHSKEIKWHATAAVEFIIIILNMPIKILLGISFKPVLVIW